MEKCLLVPVLVVLISSTVLVYLPDSIAETMPSLTYLWIATIIAIMGMLYSKAVNVDVPKALTLAWIIFYFLIVIYLPYPQKFVPSFLVMQVSLFSLMYLIALTASGIFEKEMGEIKLWASTDSGLLEQITSLCHGPAAVFAVFTSLEFIHDKAPFGSFLCWTAISHCFFNSLHHFACLVLFLFRHHITGEDGIARVHAEAKVSLKPPIAQSIFYFVFYRGTDTGLLAGIFFSLMLVFLERRICNKRMQKLRQLYPLLTDKSDCCDENALRRAALGVIQEPSTGKWIWRSDFHPSSFIGKLLYPDGGESWKDFDVQTSQGLERCFLAGVSNVNFHCNNRNYTIDLVRMEQTNTSTMTVRSIRRVPSYNLFLSESLLLHLTYCEVADMALFKNISPKSYLYGNLVGSIKEKLPNTLKIVSVHRINNAVLHKKFLLEKEELENKLQSSETSKCSLSKLLFHGTSDESITLISKQGFNRSFAGGRNGALYGQGVYFAKDPAMAYGYSQAADPYSPVKKLLLCEVLIGVYTTGNVSMVTPQRRPQLGRGESLNNCCYSTVNNVFDPTIFASCYRDNHAYPWYVISVVETG
eukprot:m.205919 g.205919  ORF g.205919 m.205919 type:complete len:586 (+) comp39666_c0_seq11:228-1985(+)